MERQRASVGSMERQRASVGSLDSHSAESMSLCSSGSNSGSKELVTNNSFLATPPTHITTIISTLPKDRLDHTQPPLPVGPPGQDINLAVVSESHAVKVATLVQQVFPGIKVTNTPSAWLKTLLPLLSRVVTNTPPEAAYDTTQRLQQHMRVTSAGKLTLDLVAASMLMFHPHLRERRHANMNASIPKVLPAPLRDMVSIGVFVPMAHMLYAEALMLGSVCHVLPSGEEATSDPYPLNTNEPPPEAFLALIKRADVLRGVSTHAFTLAYRFPLLAADMHGLIRHMAILTFAHKLPAAAAMELYDAFFKEFERQVCLTTVMPLDQFPSWLVESVFARYDITPPPPIPK